MMKEASAKNLASVFGSPPKESTGPKLLGKLRLDKEEMQSLHSGELTGSEYLLIPADQFDVTAWPC